MFVKPGLTLVEIVICLGLTALIFSVSTVPILYVYRQLAATDENQILTLLGAKITTGSLSAFSELDLKMFSQGKIQFIKGNIKMTLLDLSPCNPFITYFRYGTTQQDYVVECDKYMLQIFSLGKINTVLRTIEQ